MKYLCFLLLLLLFFIQSGFSFATINESQDCRERVENFCNNSLPLLPASQTLRHQPGDYRRELTSAHRQQPDPNREPLVSELKSLTTMLRTLISYVPCYPLWHYIYIYISLISLIVFYLKEQCPLRTSETSISGLTRIRLAFLKVAF